VWDWSIPDPPLDLGDLSNQKVGLMEGWRIESYGTVEIRGSWGVGRGSWVVGLDPFFE
jgi:hypothetical protein